MFGSETNRYCHGCRTALRHSRDKLLRVVAERERQHAERDAWPGWSGGSVAAFRLYLACGAWDHERLADMIEAAIGQPCEGHGGAYGGCADSYRVAGQTPYLIRDWADATIDVIDPGLPPAMDNLQILCKTCNSSKQRMTPTRWGLRRQGMARWMIAKFGDSSSVALF